MQGLMVVGFIVDEIFRERAVAYIVSLQILRTIDL